MELRIPLIGLFYILIYYLRVCNGFASYSASLLLTSSQSIRNTEWNRIINWGQSTNGGYHLSDLTLTDSASEITIPKTGIYLIGASLTLTGADLGQFYIAIVINNNIENILEASKVQKKGEQLGTQTIATEAILSINVNDVVGIYVKATEDDSWVIAGGAQSSFFVKAIGNLESSTGFAAQLKDSQLIDKLSDWQIIRQWKTAGFTGLFQSGTGFSDSSGQFSSSCDGIYMFIANVRITPNEFSKFLIGFSINGDTTNNVVHVGLDMRSTVSVSTILHLKAGDLIGLSIYGNDTSYTVDSGSGFFGLVISKADATVAGFSGASQADFESSGGGWMKIPMSSAQVGEQGQFQRSELNDVSDGSYFAPQDGQYIVSATILLETNSPVVSAILSLRTDSLSLSNSMAGNFETVTRQASQGVVAFTLIGVFYLSNLQPINAFIYQQSSETYKILKGSRFSACLAQSKYPSLHELLTAQAVFTADNTWVEITEWSLGTEVGVYTFTSSFTSGRYTTELEGSHYIAVNLIFENVDGPISALVSVNGKLSKREGLFSTKGNPMKKDTLNVAGTLLLSAGDYISVFVKVSGDTSWSIGSRSTLSVVFISPSFSTIGFTSVLSSRVTGSIGWKQIGNFIASGVAPLFEIGGGFDASTGEYVAHITGLYLVAANLKLQTASAINSKFTLTLAINGDPSSFTYLNGINDRVEQTSNPPASNDFYTMSITGVVYLTTGDTASLWIEGSVDSDWSISEDSSYSIVLAADQGLTVASGLHSVLDAGISQVVTSATSYKKIRYWITGRPQTAPGQFSREQYIYLDGNAGTINVKESGLYYISASIVVSNARGEFELVAFSTSASASLFTTIDNQQNDVMTLKFCGVLYLPIGSAISLQIRSTKSSWQQEIRYCGFTAMRIMPYGQRQTAVLQTNPSMMLSIVEKSWRRLSGFKPSLHPSFVLNEFKFDTTKGIITISQDAIYILTAVIIFSNTGSGNSSAFELRLGINGDTTLIEDASHAGNGLAFSTHICEFVCSTVLSGTVLLRRDDTLGLYISSDQNQTMKLLEGSTFTLVAIKQVAPLPNGMLGYLHSTVRILFDGTQPTDQWNAQNTGGSFSASSGALDGFSIAKSGVYIVTINMRVKNQVGLLELHASVNNIGAISAAKRIKNGEETTITLSGCMYMASGVSSTVTISSDADTDYMLINGSSKSILRLESKDKVIGFTARLGSSYKFSVKDMEPYVFDQWSTSDTLWVFASGNGLESNQKYHVPNSGLYYITANIRIDSVDNFTAGYVDLYLSQNGIYNPASTLYSRQYLSDSLQTTLSLAGTLYLAKWTVAELAIAAEYNLEIQLNMESTFTIVKIDHDVNPSFCGDPGPRIVKPLLPEVLRVIQSTEVIYNCDAVGTDLTYSWSRDFKVIPGATTNVLTIARSLAKDTGHYICTVTSNGISTDSMTAHLMVFDPYPVFIGGTFKYQIYENNPISTELLNITVRAESLESAYTVVKLIIIAGDTNGSMYVNPSHTTDISQLMSNFSLDREFIPYYNISIQATNTVGLTKSIQVYEIEVLDLNDNAPKFSQLIHIADVSEDAPIGTEITTVSATDDDLGENAIIQHFIIPGSARDVFRMNQSTGVITLEQNLDRETRSLYTLYIRATDGVFTTFTELIINVLDINEFSPIFDPSFYNISVSESLASGSSILRVLASDEDTGSNGLILYSIASGSENGLFRITETGEIINTQNLDYERNTTFRLEITCTDDGTPRKSGQNIAVVIINVLNSNDNVPQFDLSQYMELIDEDTAPNSHILTVRAVDEDHQGSVISYRFSKPNPMFSIDSSNGKIRLMEHLDYENQTQHTFDVLASDDGDPPATARAQVVINVVDVNDNMPIFERSTMMINVTETDSKEALPLVRVKATDLDSGVNGLVKYSLASGNELGTFLIEADSGDVLAIRALDREVTPSYTLVIIATDESATPKTSNPPLTLKINLIDVNDNEPQFSMPSYAVSVSEMAEIGDLIIYLNITDSDEGLNGLFNVSIIEEETAKLLRYDESSNGLILKKMLDFETQPRISFTVSVTDRGTPALKNSAKVVISVEDVNDNQPIFSESSYTSSMPNLPPANLTIVQVRAIDKDPGPSGQLKYFIMSGNAGNLFAIDAVSGIIRTSHAINTTGITTYELEVSANDTFEPPQSAEPVIVTIRVNRKPSLQIMSIEVGVATISFTMNVSDFNGLRIERYQLVLQEYHSDIAEFNDATILPPLFWYDINMQGKVNNNFLRRYIALEIQPFGSERRRRSISINNNVLTALIGDGVGCSLATNINKLCNGPLKQGEQYRIQVIAFPRGEQLGVESLFTKPYTLGSGSLAASFLDEADGMVGLAITYILTVLAIVFLFFIFVLWKRKHELIYVDHVVDRKILEEMPQTSLVMVNSGAYMNSAANVYQIGFNPVNGLSEISMWPRMSMAEKSHFYHRSQNNARVQNSLLQNSNGGTKNYGYEDYAQYDSSSNIQESDDEHSSESPERTAVSTNNPDILLDRGQRASEQQFTATEHNSVISSEVQIARIQLNSEDDLSRSEFGNSQSNFVNSQSEFANSQSEFAHSQSDFGNSQNDFGVYSQDDLTSRDDSVSMLSDESVIETVLGPIDDPRPSYRKNADDFLHEDESFDDMDDDDDNMSGLNINL